MKIQAIAPLFTTARLQETKAFYTDYLGFEAHVQMDCYLGLRLGEEGPSLDFLTANDEDRPAASGTGLFYCFAVECADTSYEELKGKGAPVGDAPENKPWGERSFTFDDPNGITIYISQTLTEKVESPA